MADIQYLDDLMDVEVPAPDDGDVLYWDAAAARWKHKPMPPAGGATLERIIRASEDDCQCRYLPTPGAWSTSANYVCVGYDVSTYYARGGGFRFLHIHIPKGATIVHAYLKLTSYDNQSNVTVNSKIRGELNAAPAQFSNLADYQARIRTTNFIYWDDVPAWTINTQYTSPDFKDVIKEIIDLPAWEAGNNLVIFWDDHDDRSTHVSATMRRCQTWDRHPENAAILWIEWTA